MKKSEEFVKLKTKLLRETKVSYIIKFGVWNVSIPKKCSYYFSDSIYILSKICRQKSILYGPEQIYNINEIKDKHNNMKKEEEIKILDDMPKKEPRLADTVLYYHSRDKKHNTTVCAIVQPPSPSQDSVVTFGFSKCKKTDQFSKKYGREQSYLRANEDPRAILVFKNFNSSQFITTAKKLAREVDRATDWGKSLVSSVLLYNELPTL